MIIRKGSLLQGDVLLSNYGNKSNEELLLSYGFMLDDNPADFFHVSLGMSVSAGECFAAASTHQQRTLG